MFSKLFAYFRTRLEGRRSIRYEYIVVPLLAPTLKLFEHDVIRFHQLDSKFLRSMLLNSSRPLYIYLERFTEDVGVSLGGFTILAVVLGRFSAMNLKHADDNQPYDNRSPKRLLIRV